MKYTGFHRVIQITFKEHRSSYHVSLSNEVRAHAMDAIREAYRSAGRLPPSYTAMVLKGIADALRSLLPDYPELNARITGIGPWRRIHTFDRISTGFAVSFEEAGADRAALCVLTDPDRRRLDEIHTDLHAAAAHTDTSLRSTWNRTTLFFHLPGPLQRLLLACAAHMPTICLLYRGTFLLTTVGKFGVDHQLSIPNLGSLSFGFGAIRERPVVQDGQVIPGRTLHLTATFNRKLMNGKPVALLLERARERLEHGHLASHLQPRPAHFQDARLPRVPDGEKVSTS